MKCPFPGFDPYLENPAVWLDFHNSFLIYLREALVAKLPERYSARIEEEIRVVEAPPVEAGSYRPDTSLAQNRHGSFADGGGGVAFLEPTEVVPLGEPHLEEVHEVRIEIHRWPDKELITAIEMLSPWNKTGEGYGDFVRKRRALLLAPVNWVEIDFLIAGQRVPLGVPTVPSDYRVVIARATNRPNAEIYRWNLRDPLPTIPIPLRPPDLSIPISLGEIFAMTYERCRLDNDLRRLPPDPPPALKHEEDRAWATELAAKRARSPLID